MKKFILVVALVTLVFVGGYVAWTTWQSPRPVPDAASAAPANNNATQPDASGTVVMPTIVAATLNKDGVPEQIGSLKLNDSKLGKDVMSEFEQMHGSSFDLKTGYRGDYVDGSATATLWVGQAQSADNAQTLVKEMADKIGAGNPMFTNLQSLSIGDRTIYEVDGQGQLHFFYASNDKIVWLATDATHAADALHSLWGVIK